MKKIKLSFKVIIWLIVVLQALSCKKEEKTKDAALKMQEFVIEISNYSKSINPNFIIIPQNGIELGYIDANPDNNLMLEYFAAIDGIAVEELFYNKTLTADQYRLNILRQLKNHVKKIIVSEYVSDQEQISDAVEKNTSEGFVCFVRTKNNYYYNQIPDFIYNENSENINNLSEIKNFLYLINSENFATKNEMINALKNTNYDLLLIDLFFVDDIFTNNEITQLKTKKNGSKRLVISYINIGAAEEYRYYWQPGWKLGKPAWIKKKYKGYGDEYRVEFWNQEWKNIIFGNDSSYIKKIIDAGFDGAFLDNTESYFFLYHRG
jgi:cysteinyl-tRNA synthetase